MDSVKLASLIQYSISEGSPLQQRGIKFQPFGRSIPSPPAGIAPTTAALITLTDTTANLLFSALMDSLGWPLVGRGSKGHDGMGLCFDVRTACELDAIWDGLEDLVESLSDRFRLAWSGLRNYGRKGDVVDVMRFGGHPLFPALTRQINHQRLPTKPRCLPRQHGGWDVL